MIYTKTGNDTHRVVKVGFAREHPKTKERQEYKIGDTVAPTKSELNAFTGFFEPLEDRPDEPPQRPQRDARTRQGQDSTTE